MFLPHLEPWSLLAGGALHHAIARKVYQGADPASVAYVKNGAVGDYMRRYVFDPGRTVSWNELTRYATDSELSPEAFAADFRGQ